MSIEQFLEILARMELQGFINSDTDSDDLEMIVRALLDLVEADTVQVETALVNALKAHINGGTKEITVILCKLISSLG